LDVKWVVHGERLLYESPWMSLALVDVEIPGGERFEHHVMRAPAGASGTVVVGDGGRILLLWRHRFTTDTWGWEVPAGRVDEGETPEEAARRETIEETGWSPGPLTHLCTYHPNNGQSDLRFHLFRADGATYVGEPTDPSEAERLAWLGVGDVMAAVRDGQVLDGLSLTALLWHVALPEG
jgi:8-oxo-dGTP pyrophosphatase MutT (NUDIX family)